MGPAADGRGIEPSLFGMGGILPTIALICVRRHSPLSVFCELKTGQISVATAYTLPLLVLVTLDIEVPPIARICVDSIVIFPCYCGLLIFFGLMGDWAFLRNPREYGVCVKAPNEVCTGRWKTMAVLQLTAVIAVVFAS